MTIKKVFNKTPEKLSPTQKPTATKPTVTQKTVTTKTSTIGKNTVQFTPKTRNNRSMSVVT